MRRLAVRFLVCGLSLVLITLFGFVPASRSAREATPVASPVAAEIGPGPDDYLGIERIDLGHGGLAELPNRRLRLSRITVAPGATTPPAPNETNVAADASFVLYVESGTLEATFAGPASEGGHMEVRHPAGPGQQAARTERLDPNDKVALQAGDSVFVEDALYIFHNTSGEAAIATSAVVEQAAVPRGCPCIRFP